jgi:cell division protease FtsH
VSFLKEPGKFLAIGAKIPRGVLLAGPPGTGKTLLAKAVAGEAGVPFFSVSGSEFMQMFVGVGASRVRDLFDKAGEAAPAIVFIDELDAIGRSRGGGLGMTNDEREQTLNQLLVAMDGFDERQNVIVLAATNRPDVLDPALLRPGRFDRQIVVGLPDAREREQILKVHTRAFTLEPDVDLNILAGMTIGMSGAQLANLCNEAALHAAREDKTSVRQANFDAALDKVILGDVRPLVLDANTRRVIAYHEGGHALVAWLLEKADPVHKVTIIPHGQALGVTEQRPGADQYNYPKSYLLARLAVMLGGRTAEEIVMGDITTGAENDLQQATRLARHMITAWGMSELGLAAFEGSGEDRFLGYDPFQQRQYSEQTAARIDAAVTQLLEERHQVVQKLLGNARDKLDRLAEALLSQESVGYEALVKLLGQPAHRLTGDSHV